LLPLKMLLCSALLLRVFAGLNAFAVETSAAADAVYSASQTMDIGIIAGITALAISAITIYFLRKRRR